MCAERQAPLLRTTFGICPRYRSWPKGKILLGSWSRNSVHTCNLHLFAISCWSCMQIDKFKLQIKPEESLRNYANTCARPRRHKSIPGHARPPVHAPHLAEVVSERLAASEELAVEVSRSANRTTNICVWPCGPTAYSQSIDKSKLARTAPYS